MSKKFRNACIVGIGQTELSSNSGRSTQRLAHDAITQALTDAGISSNEVDGIVPYPMGPTAEDIAAISGFGDIHFTAVPQMGGASAVAGLRLAALAVESGQADVVVVYIARNGRSAQRIDKRVLQLAGQQFRQELEYPQGLSTPAQWYALMCKRHMHDFGTSREALGTVALTMREHAQLNPRAQMFGRPLTMEDYLSAPPVAEPYLKYDCSLETDGAAAVVVTNRNRAQDARRTPVFIMAGAEGHPVPPDNLIGRQDLHRVGLSDAAPRAFAQAGIDVTDVDLALIYDCFTFEVIQQIEAMGFCDIGEGGNFVLEGNLSLNGTLPTNPHGGLLSEGHLSGLNHIAEAVSQLRHAATGRQINDAEIAVVTGWGDLGDGSISILSNREDS